MSGTNSGCSDLPIDFQISPSDNCGHFMSRNGWTVFGTTAQLRVGTTCGPSDAASNGGCRPQDSLPVETRHIELINQRWVLLFMPLVCLPFVGSFRLPSSWNPSLHRHFPVSSLLWFLGLQPESVTRFMRWLTPTTLRLHSRRHAVMRSTTCGIGWF